MATKFDSLPERSLAEGDYVLAQAEGGNTSRVKMNKESLSQLGLIATGEDAGSIVLSDGSTKAIADFFTENAEALRTAIGLATVENMGLVPPLPSPEE